ncbi:NUMOD1 domain-containing DNA-binding protein [Sphingobacterium sp.]|uniref:NUMOD1 domain-containing DNA-binding protein n=1 Tax=Sphingobacterium sp. TaxID=341027 RepID=UPI002896B5C3|nr:NUMOD1 domain-containing DNA-binding protein [Sphingobacterium sp.]
MKTIANIIGQAWQNKDLASMDGEVWKSLPELEGYGMISNYGRVKRLAFELVNTNGKITHFEERIQTLKITLYYNRHVKEYSGHLNARIQINRVCHSISVGRLVYYCFVEQFDLSDKSIYISYKDYNRLNTTPDNLFKTDLSGLQQHIIKAGRKDMHFGHSVENQALFSEIGRKVTRKQVHQYDLKGHYIATYESMSAAARQLGLQLQSISAVLSGNNYTAGGFIWRTGAKKATIPVKKINEALRAAKGYPVSQYNLKGKKIKTYYNVSTAAKELGRSARSLRNAVNGKVLFFANSIWRKGGAETINVDKENKSLELRSGYTLSQYDLTGKKIKTFNSSVEAAQYAGVQTEQINAMAIRDDLLLKGFIWRYGDAIALSKEEIESIKKDLSAEKRKDITQYDLKGKRLAYFPSMTDAAKATGIRMSSIQSVTDGFKATGGGFIWRRGHGNKTLSIPETPRPLGYKLQKEVMQYDKDGLLIKRFESIGEAARESGLHVSTISNAIRLGKGKAGGYIWKFV